MRSERLATMTLIFFSILLTFFSARVSAAAAPLAFGVAATDGTTACLIAEPGMFRPHDAVTLVFPDLPQRLVKAEIVDRLVRPCTALDGRLLPGEVFALQLADPSPSPRVPAVALRSRDASFVIRASRVHARTHGPSGDVRFRVCASSEGLHLSAWRGEPLKAPRVWHVYFYLGYDTTPDCTDADTTSRP